MRKLLFLIILLNTLLTSSIFALDEYKRDIHKQFLYKKNIQLKITNLYGNVHIVETEQDSITIDASVWLQHFDKHKANSLLNEINITFCKKNNSITANTKISKRFKTGYKFHINYEIKVPKGVSLRVNNSFGDIIIQGKINSTVEFISNYGTIQTDTIITLKNEDINYFKLNYSKGKIKNCINAKLLLHFSKIKINKCENIVASSKYSKIEIDTNQTYITNTYHDICSINSTKSLTINKGKNSHFIIDNNLEEAEVNLTGGSLSIKNINKFNSIDYLGRDSEINLNFDSQTSYALNTKLQKCTIILPKEIKIFSKKKDEINKIEEIEAIVGNEDININATVKIESINGKITIK